MTAQYKHKVEPLLYVLKLIMGIVCFIISMIIVIHLFCYILLKMDDRPVLPFLNDLLEGLESSSVSVLATILFAFIGYYLMFAAIKGNVRVGMRLLCFTFYPLLPNETFVNAFIFNAMLMNLWMFALVQFMTDMFKEYIRQTSISMIFSVQIKNMYFYAWFLRYGVFTYILVGWIFISLVYFILKPAEKLNLGLQIKKTDLASRA
jgi:LMBR1 domain-containing protein 1